MAILSSKATTHNSGEMIKTLTIQFGMSTIWFLFHSTSVTQAVFCSWAMPLGSNARQSFNPPIYAQICIMTTFESNQ